LLINLIEPLISLGDLPLDAFDFIDERLAIG
jgi:hypothetical protein